MRKQVRETSIEAYRAIKENGLLSKRRFQVYRVLYDYGPMTANEVCEAIETRESSITPRFAELQKLGVIKEVGKKPCSITGRTCVLWDVTSNVPTKFEKPVEHKCPTCNGTGKIITSQGRLF